MGDVGLVRRHRHRREGRGVVDIAVSFTDSDLVFIGSDESINFIAGDEWSPDALSRQDRAVLTAFLQLAVERLEGTS